MPKVVREEHGPVALLRLTNGVTNAIGAGLLSELDSAIREIRERFQGLVLAGNTKFFSIGLDLPELLTLDRDEMFDFWNRFEDLVLDLYTLPIPTAGALAGHAIAGGAILALTCDYRFMADGRRRIALNEVGIGVPVPYLAHLMLRQIAPDRVAVEMELASRFLGPEDAKAAGLADEVCAEEAVEARAVQRIRELAATPRPAFAATKQHRIRQIPSQFKAIRQDMNRAFLECWFMPATQALLKEAARKF
ncbi:MAG: enoyl-CoA hydratase/isomerase family protein [Hyphomicrobiales bacterium]